MGKSGTKKVTRAMKEDIAVAPVTAAPEPVQVDEGVAITCVDCGKVFHINSEEKHWYEVDMKYPLPKRCPDCRKLKRQRNNWIRNNSHHGNTNESAKV